MQAAASNPSELFRIDAISALKARLAPLSDPDDSSVDCPRTQSPKPKYRHTPTISRADAHAIAFQRPAGITKWISDRDVALKTAEAASIQRAFLKKAERDEAAAKRKPSKAPSKATTFVNTRQSAQTVANMQAYTNNKIGRRWQKFEHRDGYAAGRRYAPFEEVIKLAGGKTTGMRSHDGSISTALFASRLPKEHRLKWGADKGKLLDYDMTQRKIFILDSPYIELDPRRLGCLVVDLDTNWESEDALRKALLDILGPMRMPNLTVYRWSEDGTEMESPHLLWLLPPRDENGRDGAVGTGGKSNQGIVKFFHAVQRALVAKLAPIGADPGHHNSLKIKTPLSPFWCLLVDDSNFVSLSGWNKFLPMNVSEEEIKRLAVTHQVAATEGVPFRQSDHAWRTVFELIMAAKKTATATRDRTHGAAKRSYGAYYDWLLSKIEDEAIDLLGDNAVTRSILRKQIDYRAIHRNTRLQSAVFNRGRDRKANRAVKATIKQKREFAGTRTRDRQRVESVAAVAAAIMQTLDSGVPFVKAEIIANVKTVSRSVAYDRFDEAVEDVRDAIRYTALLNTVSPSTPSPAPKVTRPKAAIPAPAVRIPASPGGLPAFMVRANEKHALAVANKAKREQDANQNRAPKPAPKPVPVVYRVVHSPAHVENCRKLHALYATQSEWCAANPVSASGHRATPPPGLFPLSPYSRDAAEGLSDEDCKRFGFPDLPATPSNPVPASNTISKLRSTVSLGSRPQGSVQHRVSTPCGHPAAPSNSMPTSSAIAKLRSTVGLGLRSPGINLH